MADPLSITASIVTLLHLAGSVAAIGLSIRDATRSNGGILQQLLDELRGLTDVLNTLAELASDHGPETRSLRALSEPGGALDGCKHLLGTLQTELDSVVDAQGVKRLGKILRWPIKEKEVQSLVQQLSQRKSTLALALHNVQIELGHVLGVEIGVVGDLLVSTQVDIKRNKVLRWLDVGHASRSQSEACKKQQTGTGTWFLDSLDYVTWRTKHSSLIWLHGKAGCGKSILCSTIIEDLLIYSSVLPGTALAYFYFDFADTDKQSVKSLISSLLSQLTNQLPKLPSCVEALYDRYADLGQQPTEKDMKVAFIFVIEMFSNVYIPLDALDECMEREELMEFLHELLVEEIEGLHLLTTSRREREIEEGFDEHNPVQIGLEGLLNEDILLHIRSRLSRDLRLKKLAKPMKADIESALLDGAHGMFLWVDRQLDALRQCSKPAAIKRALTSLPKDLEETYNRILSRIQADEDGVKDALTVLRWLAAAVRPPTLHEVAEAIAVSPGCAAIEDDNRLFDAKELLYICSGLVILTDDSETGRLRLTHFSVKEYLLSARIRASPASVFALEEVQAHKYVAKICLTYLLTFRRADVFLAAMLDDGPTSGNIHTVDSTIRNGGDAQDKSQRIIIPKLIFRKFPLLRYAARYWSKHVRALPVEEAAELNPTVLDLMSPFKNASFLNWLRASDPARSGEYGFAVEIGDVRPPLYYAAILGLPAVVRSMLENGADPHGLSMYAAVDVRPFYFDIDSGFDIEGRSDSSGPGGIWRNPWRRPLHAAIERGHEQVVKILLSFGASVHDLDEVERTALQVACLHSRYKLVNLLLEDGADINATIDASSDAAAPVLQAAVYEGDEKLIRLLLERGADVNAQDVAGNTALQEACKLGHYRIVELLLASGARVNAQGGFNGSALQAAARMGHEMMIKLLLTHDANVNGTEGFYGSALRNVAALGLESAVRLLLSHGADVNAKGKDGTPLQAACNRPDSATIVQLLIDHGANINRGGGWLGSPLQAATMRSDKLLINQLLELGAAIDASEGEYGPALQIAAYDSDESFVELLLSRGAAVNADASGKFGTPIQAAAFHGNIAVARKLLDAGSDVNATGGKYGTAVIAAAFAGKHEIVSLLLDSGANVNATGSKYETALIASAFYGHEETVRLLLDSGADVSPKSDFAGNVLAAATIGRKGPHGGVLLLLHERGVTEMVMPEDVVEEEEEELDSDVDFSIFGEGDYRDDESVALSGELNEELANS